MKSALAKARDKWFVSDDGKECCDGTATGQYLHNRLDRAFLAGANFSSERTQELETVIKDRKCQPCIDIKQGTKAQQAETELEKAAKKCARTGTRKDLQAYLKLRRESL